MDRGAWQATVLRITKNQTQLKRLSMHTILYMDSNNLQKKENEQIV